MTARIDIPKRLNVADYFIHPHLAEGRGGKPFLYCGEESLTFLELHEGANRVGNVLKELGLRAGERVMLLMEECLLFPMCFFGAIRLGAVPLPVNTVLKTDDYRYFLNDSGAKALIVDAALWPLIESIEPLPGGLEQIVVVNGHLPGKNSLEKLMAQAGPEFESRLMGADEQAFWLYTSGSTGPPKAAVHLQRDMVYCAQTFGKQVLGLTTEDLGFSAAKFFFAYGLGNSLYLPLAAGARAVINPGAPTAEALLGILARFRPTVFFGVPTHYNGIVNLYESWLAEGRAPGELPDLSHLKFAVSAGESLPPGLYRRWRELFGCEILDGIGTTEMLNFFIMNRRGKARPGSTGTLVPGYEARLEDEQGRAVPDGKAGVLLVKGGSGAPYYWNQPERSRAAMREGWFVTGDRFIRDAEGYYWYQGRNDDMMKVGGSWVSPAEVEHALISHGAVAECAVVGHKQKSGLIKPKAFVVPQPGHHPSPALKEALMAHMAGQIAHFKLPGRVEFVTELPKTATGKIKRFQLRQ